jgi:hypothetical protein
MRTVEVAIQILEREYEKRGSSNTDRSSRRSITSVILNRTDLQDKRVTSLNFSGKIKLQIIEAKTNRLINVLLSTELNILVYTA